MDGFMKYLKWIAVAVLLIILLIVFIVGFQKVRERDATVTKVVEIVNRLQDVSDTLTIMNGGTVERDDETGDEDLDGMTPAPSPVTEETEQPEETTQPKETEGSEAAAQPAATARATSTPGTASTTTTTTTTTTRTTPRPTATAAPAAPTATAAPTPEETTAQETVTPVATDTPSETTQPDPVETEHVHNWETVTIQEQGHNETVTRTVQTGTRTVVDQEGYSDEEGNWHDAVTHEEPVYEEVSEQVWIVDSPASTYSRCTICGATG